MQRLLLAAAAAAAASLFGPVFATEQSAARVLTTSGTLVGHQASNRSCVTEFLGIRYAEAPVGELRFAAPKKYVAAKGTVFEASEWVSTRGASFAPRLANRPSQSTCSQQTMALSALT